MDFTLEDDIDIVFDVGACHGESVFRFPSSKLVYCFEPSDYNREILEQRHKGDRRVKSYPYAISDVGGKRHFNFYRGYAYCSFHDFDTDGEFWNFIKHHDYEGIEEIDHEMNNWNHDVDTIRLDHFMDTQGIKYIDYLKIDTQGHDLNVIKSLGDKINSVKYIEFEVQLKPLYKDTPRKEEFLKFFSNYDFDLVHEECNYELVEDYEVNMIFKNRKTRVVDYSFGISG